MVFVLDNYDSFTYNLVQYMGELGAEMVIRRFVVAPGGVERIQVETRPELLIAFVPTVVREHGEADRTMAGGSVLWAKVGENLEVMAASSAAAHVLTVRLLK